MLAISSLRGPDLAAVVLLLRRLAAMLYDALLLTALLFAASLPLILLIGDAIPPSSHRYRFFLLAIIFVYLGWHWTHGGQTLGMKSWRLQIISRHDSTVNWQQSLLRFLAALLSMATLGLGYLWLLIDGERQTWHDRLSGTRLISVDREK